MSLDSEQLKIVIVGHVDHGKSTLIGRLFYDTGSLPEGRYEQLAEAARRRGVPFEFANLTDGLQAERDQNITIDTTQIWFSSARRRYVIIDAPGHKEFLKNMVTGAASAHAALLLIDASEGMREQSRRHGYLLRLLGVRQVVVLVNKMDLCGYDPSVFARVQAECAQFLAEIDVQPRCYIPIAAREGDNVAAPSLRMPWYDGPCVLDAMDELTVPASQQAQPLRFPIQDVYRFDRRRILAGRLESGSLRVGDRLVFWPSGKSGVVATIEQWGGTPPQQARAGESIGITLAEQIFVERGQIATHEDAAPIVTSELRANVFWMGREPLRLGASYVLKLTTEEVGCKVAAIEHVLDANTLVPVAGSEVGRYQVAQVVLQTLSPLALDVRSEMAATARFVLVHGREVSGGGNISSAEVRTSVQPSVEEDALVLRIAALEQRYLDAEERAAQAVRGQAQALLLLLQARDVSLSDAQRTQVLDCSVPTTLDLWIRRAVATRSAEEVLR